MSNKLRSIGNFGGEYKSPTDFTATFTSSTTITLSSLPFTIVDSSQIKSIVQIKANNTSNVYVNGIYGVTLTVSSNVITIHNAGTPFVTGDKYEISINANTKSYDSTQEVTLVSVTNPIYAKYIDASPLTSAVNVGADDDTWIDAGSEIPCNQYKTLGLYVNYTKNDSTGSMLQILSKHESAGSDEYVLETSSSYQKTFGEADIKVAYFFDVTAVPYVQLQTKATNVSGSGTTIATTTIDYVLGY
jgi:hypothetical protein